ncbi:PiggyBac transposable element-derived protein 4-like [Elysia marginata]|uniref:PiggyBac transposable element-derived protein 4-like n=1 Tax=Elysia marginata TaxID=1093978 RepID=A0AAV4JEW9_9GAST|nr:PiggyBac transposable element-derived protein 4-like [Elysia marginata]
MADSRPGPSRQTSRLTAQQARLLFEKLETDSELDNSSDEESVPAPEASDSDTDISPVSEEATASNAAVSEQGDGPPPRKRRNIQDEDSPAWKKIQEDEAETRNNFRFLPPNQPGLQADLDDQSSALDAFQTLFTIQVVEFLLKSINDYAEHRCSTNQPAQRQAIFNEWKKVTLSELYKFIAVILQIVIDKPVSTRLCFVSKDSPSYKPCCYHMFARPRFEAIY